LNTSIQFGAPCRRRGRHLADHASQRRRRSEGFAAASR